YAREIEGLLAAALPRIVELLPETDDRRLTTDKSDLYRASSMPIPSGAVTSPAAPPPIGGERVAAAGRIVSLLQVAVQMPDVLDWPAARGRIEADLAQIAGAPAGPADLIAAYAGLLRAALALLPATPSAGQLGALQRAAARLLEPIGQPDLNELSAQLATLPGLA
ncbi:MAG TPA: hypothetical protein VF897_16640, partial [Roseiflexaceae bacterium]